MIIFAWFSFAFSKVEYHQQPEETHEVKEFSGLDVSDREEQIGRQIVRKPQQFKDTEKPLVIPIDGKFSW